MLLTPKQFYLDLETLEQKQIILRSLEGLVEHPGYNLLQRLADGLAYEAYVSMLKGKKTELSEVSYWKGASMGLENLFNNLQEQIEAIKEEIKEEKEEEDEDAHETLR